MEKTIRLLTWILCLALVLGSMAACAAPAQENAPSGDPAPGGEVPSGGDTPLEKEERDFVMRLESDYNSLDPAKCTSTPEMVLCNNMYSKLIKIDAATNTIKGDLAETWSVSDDGKVYTFNLKQGVKFHDGTELKAQDVVYTTNRIIEVDYQIIFTNVNLISCEATDDYTVVYTLGEAYAPFLNLMCGNFFVVSKAYCEAGNDLANAPMGSGPYKFVSATSGYETIVERFDDYFMGKPEIKRVVARVISDVSAVSAALQTGELSYADFDFTSYEELKTNADLEITTPNRWLLQVLRINNTAQYLDNKLVRQALGYAVNRQLYVDSCLEGFGVPGSYYLMSNVVDFPKSYDKTFTYDVEKAKALLAEAGYADGFKLTLSITGDSQAVAVLLQADLAKIGIDVDIETMEWGALSGLLNEKQYDITLVTCGTGDFFDAWSAFIVSDGAYNSTGYANPALDELLVKATVPGADVEECYRQALDIYMEDAPVHGLYEYGPVIAMNTAQFVAKSTLNRVEYLDIYDIGYAG